jgi:hypothetical protein
LVCVDLISELERVVVRAILVGDLPDFGPAANSVWRGHRTICVLQFPAGIPSAIAALPEVDGCLHKIVARVGVRAIFERTRGPEAPPPSR